MRLLILPYMILSVFRVTVSLFLSVYYFLAHENLSKDHEGMLVSKGRSQTDLIEN